MNKQKRVNPNNVPPHVLRGVSAQDPGVFKDPIFKQYIEVIK